MYPVMVRRRIMRILVVASFALVPLSAVAQLLLPYSGIDSTATISAFQIRKTGSTGRANTLYITTPTNASDVLLVNTVGLGRAGYFQLNNASSSNQALRADSNGSGVSVFGLMTGTGRAGTFRIINPFSANNALFVETDCSAPALKVVTTGALAAQFMNAVRIDSPTAGYTGLEIQSTGSGNTTGILSVVTSSSSGTTAVSASARAATGVTYGGYFESESNEGRGVVGDVGSTTGATQGVRGTSGSNQGRGVYGLASANNGTTTGVFGEAASPTGRGVLGTATSGSGANVGVYGGSVSPDGTGVFGIATNQAGNSFAGYFINYSGTGTGVFGYSVTQTGVNYGVHGRSDSATDGFGVYSTGRFAASGTKAFRIDHPLDPTQKFLNHYCAEGPEPLNIYRGKITTDERGFAWVQMPDYYENINKDPTIQLTVVDGSEDFVMAKVSRRLQSGRFQIRTNKASTEVDWEVKATRNDRFVKVYGAPIETRKSKAERGTYQHPELYGKAPSPRKGGPLLSR